MIKQSPTFGIKFTIFLIYLIGFGLHVWVFWDITFSPSTSNNALFSNKHSKNSVENVRKSIMFIKSGPCVPNGPDASGTGFVIKPGYIATNAHVVKIAESCNEYLLTDYLGKTHPAKLKTISSSSNNVLDEANPFANDLAILQFDDSSHQFPPLELTDSSEYEANHETDKVITIGYPLEGHASTPGKATVSNEGIISNFDSQKHLFAPKGLLIDPGNSGGPVFLCKNYKVVGVVVATSKISKDTAFFIPINRLKNFVREKLNIEL